MGVLGKDLMGDIFKSRFRVRVQFGERHYWIEDDPEPIPYGAVLTEIFDFDDSAFQESVVKLKAATENSIIDLDYMKGLNLYLERTVQLREAIESDEALLQEARAFALAYYESTKLPLYNRYLDPTQFFPPREEPEVYELIAKDLKMIKERYARFLDDVFRDATPEKKKGQKKETPAQRIFHSLKDAYVSGVSLGENREVDSPDVNIQYAIIGGWEGNPELVEKMYFDRLIDFVYVEFMKGMQKGFIPKRCLCCGHWFLQELGATYSYCTRIAPGETEKTCREVGAVTSFQAKARENDVWKYHQRAYKKYFARIKAGTMTQAEFNQWSLEAERIRDEALKNYNRARTVEERTAIAEEVKQKLNRA